MWKEIQYLRRRIDALFEPVLFTPQDMVGIFRKLKLVKREMKLSYPFGRLVVAQIWSYDTTIEY